MTCPFFRGKYSAKFLVCTHDYTSFSSSARGGSHRKAIRDHMAMIAGLFSQGDFSLPMFIHATTPPGVETMKRLKTEITYHAEKTVGGTEVRIATKNPEALSEPFTDFSPFK